MNDHPYTLDRWATPDDPEIASIRFADLRKIERACQGIWAIARIVGNSTNEPDNTGAQPLDPWVTSNLLGGIESLCDHVADLVEVALDGAPLGFGLAAEEYPVQ
ncbi:hypothetical protein [Achromobacter denitrificans]|uniref:hypothetical protein n=1 Tax=Achromobacter denitrificans TaxID=32002 RepID=UPI000F4E88AD|nr:hypothetical protein [Achromobacter denitrificans]QCS65456.1 hypothetical protein EC609_25215 [Achromobacter denitrificans]RSE87015.1 hypothetical protein EGU64_10335 [Achromobacter denitrificans]